MLRSLFRDESGFIVSAELVLIGTLVVLGMITGLVCLRSAVVDELASLGAAFRGMNQTYYTPAFLVAASGGDAPVSPRVRSIVMVAISHRIH